uniref:GRAM domain-containing protein 1A (Trinotate prediction) n=1 Tax=Myxobolus squamalis TaxID=59785 RepID=A0A6B2FZV8_MYXSQ
MISAQMQKKMEFLSKSFHDITEGDLVVTDFSCSLQSDVLIQGRIYLSYYGYYFHSKILGFITTACGYWVDVCELKKDKAAFLLPIILHITTNSEKVLRRVRNAQHTFSFIQNRNTAYAIIKMIWLNHRTEMVRI